MEEFGKTLQALSGRCHPTFGRSKKRGARRLMRKQIDRRRIEQIIVPVPKYMSDTFRADAQDRAEEIECPRCKSDWTFHRAEFPRMDSSGFETRTFFCNSCRSSIRGLIDPFDGALLLSVEHTDDVPHQVWALPNYRPLAPQT